MASDDVKAREQALLLLGRREHSRQELLTRLKRSGFSTDAIITVLDDIAAQGWQSDERFTEQYVRYRQQRGYGPTRIEQELKMRGINDELISHYLVTIDWCALAASARNRRFGEALPDNWPAQAKEMRFLQYRGFTQEQIHQLYKMGEQ